MAMSGHAVTHSPLGLAYQAPLCAPHSVTLWNSSPPKPTSTQQQQPYDFDVEELSENDMEYADHHQVLYPYELEEVDSAAEDAKDSSPPLEIYDQDSDSAASARQLRSMRWKPASRPCAFTRPLPTRSTPRKRLRSETPDTDTESDPYTRSEPPRLRRRTHVPDKSFSAVTPSTLSNASTPSSQAPAADMIDDLMDMDEQATLKSQS